MQATEYQKKPLLSDWIEVKVTCPAAREEEISCWLIEHGAGGVEVIDNALIMAHLTAGDWDASVFDGQDLPTGQVVLRTLVPLSEQGRGMVEALHAYVETLAETEVACQVVPPVDWQEKWKEGFAARPIGERLWLRPYWDKTPVPEGRLALNIHPGMAFGTGDHPTTSMALALLDEYIKEGSRVLDLGCGSGILGIAALLLGASEVIGVDIDPICEEAVKEHLRLNGIAEDKFRFYCGDILSDEKLQRKLRQNKADLVLANITADVLKDLSPLITRYLNHGGLYITSGILADYAGEVAQAITYGVCAVIQRRQEGEWVTYLAVPSFE